MRAVLALVLAACAGEARPAAPPAVASAPAPQVAGPSALGLVPGETMAFEVKLAGITAGEAQLAVGEPGDVDGHRAVVVKSRAETTGAAAIVRHAVDESTTTIDVATGLPLALETRVEQGDQKGSASATFHTSGARHSADVTFQRGEGGAAGPARPQHLEFGTAEVHDAHSAMAQLRAWRAAPGDKRAVFVVGGRRLWRVDVTYAGDDTIGLAVGNRRAMKFTGEAFRVRRDLSPEADKPGRTFAVWLSADADRVPLKLVAKTELGEIAMELTEYTR